MFGINKKIYCLLFIQFLYSVILKRILITDIILKKYAECYMLNKIVAILVLLAGSVSSAVAEPITKVESLNEISTDYPEKTIIFFNITDTLINSSQMLGSKGWRKFVKNVAPEVHDKLTLFLAYQVPVVSAEPITSRFIKELEAKGYAVCGLTGRERNIWYNTPAEAIDILTINQLASVGIYFDVETFEATYPTLASDFEYYEGVFFANTEAKGDYLRKILHTIAQTSEMPTKIICIDDKLSQIESLVSVLKEFDVDYQGYWYCGTDEKAKKFHPMVTNIQLEKLLFQDLIITDEEAELIVQSMSEVNAALYFKDLISLSDIGSQ